jgi:hypothetical protein
MLSGEDFGEIISQNEEGIVKIRSNDSLFAERTAEITLDLRSIHQGESTEMLEFIKGFNKFLSFYITLSDNVIITIVSPTFNTEFDNNLIKSNAIKALCIYLNLIADANKDNSNTKKAFQNFKKACNDPYKAFPEIIKEALIQDVDKTSKILVNFLESNNYRIYDENSFDYPFNYFLIASFPLLCTFSDEIRRSLEFQRRFFLSEEYAFGPEFYGREIPLDIKSKEMLEIVTQMIEFIDDEINRRHINIQNPTSEDIECIIQRLYYDFI